LRKPPPVDVDAFVTGEPKPAKATDVRALAPVKVANEITLKTEAGSEMREMTIVLPVDLARKIALRCAEKDRDASNLVADALAAHLDAPAPKAAPRKTTTPAAAGIGAWARSMATLFRQRLLAV